MQFKQAFIFALFTSFCSTENKVVSVFVITQSGFIRVREMSGKFKFFQGQGIVREFYAVSGKNEYLLKCQGNVSEFYDFQFV